MSRLLCIDPIVGDWYASHGQLFEVVAVDEDERVIEVQHADGDLEELDRDDWLARCRAGSLRQAEQPEDARVAEDRDAEDEVTGTASAVEELHSLNASPLDDLDLFD
jgi:ATP-dependent helicase YprA (DUF1998 family)